MINGKTCLCEVGVGPMGMAYGALLWDRPDIELLMFEPHPEYYKQVLEAANGRPNVKLYNVAIGDEDGTMEFFDEGTSSSLANIASPVAQHYKKPESEKRKFTVDVRRILNYDYGQIDILRIDTEGAEWFALKHLLSRPSEIVVETHNDLATYINPYLFEIEEWAEKNGYRKVSIYQGDFIYHRK